VVVRPSEQQLAAALASVQKCTSQEENDVTTSKTAPYPDPRRPVLVRADEAERLDSIGHVLLADSSTTQEALSSHRIALARGADGAAPHRHDKASELFFILSGELDVLTGDKVITAAAGALIVITPGIERFDYFRHVVRLRAGTGPREILLTLQDQFDTHFVESAARPGARAS
jgi:mannose-6-phosphate isomerase-like protein (cupin superfamily)